jgi:putative MFS transporter
MSGTSNLEGPLPVTVGALFEDLPLTRVHLKCCVALFVAYVIEAWEMMIIVYASPAIAREYPMTPVELGSMIGAMFVGMLFGSLAWGALADRIGRKKSVVWSLAGYAVISFASGFAPNWTSLYLLRLLSGVVAAGLMVATFPLFEELLPVKYRGRYTVYLASGWPIGMILALAVTIAFDRLGWRWILGISSMAGAWIWMVQRWVPESPYWLAENGRQMEAKTAIAYLSGGKLLLAPHLQLRHEAADQAGLLAIFKRRALRVTLIQVAVNFCYAWGFWGLQSWMPTLLHRRGMDVPQSNGFILFTACSMVPGYLAAASLTGRYGRKRVVVAFVGISACAGLGFALASSLASLYLCTFLLSFFSLGGWGVWDTWLAELYPTTNRTAGYGFGVFAQRLSNTIAPSVTGFFIARSTSFGLTVEFIDVFLVATVLLVLLLPETEGHVLT